MNEDELREALSKERVRNDQLQHLVRRHWNEIMRLREENALLRDTMTNNG